MTTDLQKLQAELNRREAAARRYAEERGLKLRKSRTRNPNAATYGRYALEIWPPSGVQMDPLAYLREQLAEVDTARFGRYLAVGTLESGHPLTLDEVEAILDAPTVWVDGFKFTRAPASYRCTYRNR